MKRASHVSFLVLIVTFLTFGQAVPAEDKEAEAERQRRAAFNTRVDSLRNVGKNRVIRDRYKNTKTYQQIIKPLYRNPDPEEMNLLKVDSELTEDYKDLIKENNTNIIKLIFDKGCDEKVGVVVSTPHCLKYKMPGAGASYSFRTNKHSVKRLSDITFLGKTLASKGTLTHGIFVDLGKVKLDNLTLKSSGITVLSGFSPPKSMEQARKLFYQLEKGIRGERYTYASFVKVIEGNTYALRSIAYKGKSYQTIKDVTYDEFEFDKRKDVIVVFQVLKVDDESVSVLWKKLKSEKSNHIKK